MSIRLDPAGFSPPGREDEGEAQVLLRYAQILGVGLLLLGGAGMLGVGTTNPAVDLDHLFVGSLLAYASFRRRDEKFVRVIVRGLGLIYLLAVVLAFGVPALLLGLFPDTPNGIVLNHSVHLVVGVSNITAASLLRGRPSKTLRGRVQTWLRLPVQRSPEADTTAGLRE